MTSSINGKSMTCGHLETPNLAELRSRVQDHVQDSQAPAAPTTINEVVADAKHLHTDASNTNALFQVASQFNLLEMPGPSVTPEDGVSAYSSDHTQGPACAFAAGAGTIYRNYFASVGEHIGQSSKHQIDCLADIGTVLGNEDDRLWTMQNGYALATRSGLEVISRRINSMGPEERDTLRQQLRIGLQWDTQVTLDGCEHLVSQAYCSALPVGYSQHPPDLWKAFAQLVLEASYEATLCATVLNRARNGNNRVYLTLVGGGVFGNDVNWILTAIGRAVGKFADAGLDIVIVSYGTSNARVQALIGLLPENAYRD